jgi:predicted nucleic acid-binding protein
MRLHADARIGFVDASAVALAERLGVSRILTLDRRDFGLVRPRHVGAFLILP